MIDERLVQRITGFLDANYPCRCDDPECPGNQHEAVMIVEILEEHLRGRA